MTRAPQRASRVAADVAGSADHQNDHAVFPFHARACEDSLQARASNFS